MDKNNNDFNSGHRMRLRQKFAERKLADYELFELLLTYAIPRVDVKPLAKMLMEKFGGVHGILTASIESLIEIPGIKINTAIFIKSIHEIMLLDYKNQMDSTPVFRDYKRLEDYCKLLLWQKSIEEFHVLYLDLNQRLLVDDLHSVGTIDWAAVYPREIAKRALSLNASSLILIHNHPTGQGTFSTEDIKITQEIKNVLGALGISVFDHLLVAGGIVFSAKNMFLIK